MTAGIYLVSACGSAEEFVAAFRRYADKTGLFIPIASPLPQGKRGHFALTLADGGVMLEGDAEIIQSSAKSPLHGRAGIQLKFVELDDASKIVLAELEKARLAMKPAPLSVPPRQGNVPAAPRPTPPPTGGRIDAANALAECVAIGDASKLEDAGPPKAGPKFVVPSIPALGGPARPKTPSTPPEGISAPSVGKLTSMGMPAMRPPAESGPVKVEPRADPTPLPAPVRPDTNDDQPALPAAARTATLRDAAPAPRKDAPPATAPKSTAAFDAAWGEEEAAPAAPMAKTGSAPSGATSAPTAADNGGLPVPKAPAKTKMTQIGFPVVRLPADGPPKATALGVVPLHADEPTATGVSPPTPAPPKLPEPAAEKPAKPPLPQPTPTRTKSPTAPPRNPTPHVPLPVAKMPAKPAPLLADDAADEKTDLTSTPPEPTGDGAVVIENKPPREEPAPEAKPQRSGGMRASEIMAAVTSDDWTMTPDASAPTVLPADQRAPAIEEPTPGPTPTGDWTMSLDPAAGWSKPEKVAAPTPPADKPTKIERPKAAIQTPATGNELKSVSSEKPIEVQAWEDKPTSIGEKIEIDATLMEPAEPMPAIDVDEVRPGNGSGSFAPMTEQMPAASSDGFAAAYGSAPGLPMMQPAAFEPQQMPSAIGPEAAILPLPPPPMTVPPPLPQEVPIGYAPTLLPGQMTAPPIVPPPLPAMPLQYATAQPGDLYRSDALPVLPPRSNKRLIVIAAAVLLVVGVAVVLALTMSHGKKKPLAEKHTGSAAVVMATGSGSAQPAVAMPDAAVVEPPAVDAAAQEVVAPPPPKNDTCTVEVTTTPAGAEVSLDDKTVLGTTPASFTLPCGQATKLNLKKAKFLAATRSVTPTPAGVKVAVALAVPTFAVKITSTPAGATIFVGGKSKGVTPTAVQLPAFQTVKITVAKDGYAPDTSNLAIKANGQSHHVTLKKAGRRGSSDSHGLKGI